MLFNMCQAFLEWPADRISHQFLICMNLILLSSVNEITTAMTAKRVATI